MQGSKPIPTHGKPQQGKPQASKTSVERKIIRIADTDLNGDKKVGDALRDIYGVSFSFSNAIMKVLGIEYNKKLQEIDESNMAKLKEALLDPKKYNIPEWLCNWRKDERSGLDHHYVGNELKSKATLHIQTIKNSRTYRGYRHSFNYKVRGQRVKSRGANVRGRIGSTIGVTKKTAQQQQAATEEKKK